MSDGNFPGLEGLAEWFEQDRVSKREASEKAWKELNNSGE